MQRGFRGWKWVSFALTLVAVPVVPVLGLLWVLEGLFLNKREPEPEYPAYGGSFGLLLLAVLAAATVWVIGCVLQRRRDARTRRSFLVVTVVIVAGFLVATLPWAPVAVQHTREDDYVAELRRLDTMMPKSFGLGDTDNGKGIGSEFVEPEWEWSVPDDAKPCKRLGPILTRWAGERPAASKGVDGNCSFVTDRYGWRVEVKVYADAELWNYPADRSRVELTSAA